MATKRYIVHGYCLFSTHISTEEQKYGVGSKFGGQDGIGKGQLFQENTNYFWLNCFMYNASHSIILITFLV